MVGLEVLYREGHNESKANALLCMVDTSGAVRCVSFDPHTCIWPEPVDAAEQDDSIAGGLIPFISMQFAEAQLPAAHAMGV